MFREFEYHNLLKEIEEKRLQWFSHVERKNRARTPKMILELKFKGNKGIG
jgi:hypothetical protein